MRIGISVITHADQNIWENGLGQNTLHLARLFRSLPFVENVLLLNCGDQDGMPSQVADDAAGRQRQLIGAFLAFDARLAATYDGLLSDLMACEPAP